MRVLLYSTRQSVQCEVVLPTPQPVDHRLVSEGDAHLGNAWRYMELALQVRTAVLVARARSVGLVGATCELWRYSICCVAHPGRNLFCISIARSVLSPSHAGLQPPTHSGLQATHFGLQATHPVAYYTLRVAGWVRRVAGLRTCLSPNSKHGDGTSISAARVRSASQ